MTLAECSCAMDWRAGALTLLGGTIGIVILLLVIATLERRR